MQIDPDYFRDSPRAGTSTVDPTLLGPKPITPLKNVGLTAGFTPNYKNLILANPAYLSWKNSANLDVTQAASARKAALKALAMQYGGLAGGFQDSYGDIDPETLSIAKNNQFSDIARLGRNYEQGVTNVKRSLAARGGLQSGELGYGLDRQNLAKASGEYDASQQFGNTAQSVINNYLATEAASRRAEQDALIAAEANVYANPMNRPVEGTSANLDPDWQSYSSVPIYTGPDGRKYKLDANGNPVEWSVPAAPSPLPPEPPTPPPYEPPPTDGAAKPLPPGVFPNFSFGNTFAGRTREQNRAEAAAPQRIAQAAAAASNMIARPAPQRIPEATRRKIARGLFGF